MASGQDGAAEMEEEAVREQAAYEDLLETLREVVRRRCGARLLLLLRLRTCHLHGLQRRQQRRREARRVERVQSFRRQV